VYDTSVSGAFTTYAGYVGVDSARLRRNADAAIFCALPVTLLLHIVGTGKYEGEIRASGVRTVDR
jgi:hypothetical protein